MPSKEQHQQGHRELKWQGLHLSIGVGPAAGVRGTSREAGENPKGFHGTWKWGAP